MITTRSLPSLIGACAAFALSLCPVIAQDAPPGDPNASWVLVSNAWKAKQAGKDDEVLTWTDKCIQMYGGKAVEMQKSLTAPPDTTPANKENVFKNWAVNDVGTAYFIKGQVLEKQGKTAEAIAAYKYLVDNLGYAQCWDTNGWFWGPAGAASERIKALQFDALPTSSAPGTNAAAAPKK